MNALATFPRKVPTRRRVLSSHCSDVDLDPRHSRRLAYDDRWDGCQLCAACLLRHTSPGKGEYEGGVVIRWCVYSRFSDITCLLLDRILPLPCGVWRTRSSISESPVCLCSRSLSALRRWSP